MKDEYFDVSLCELPLTVTYFHAMEQLDHYITITEDLALIKLHLK
jgi:hypothetical protein